MRNEPEDTVEIQKQPQDELNPIQPPPKKRRSSKGITLLIGFFTGISRILGFIRQIVFVHFYGAGQTADIFNFAFNIPNNLRKLLAEGALSSAYIPEISSALQEDPTRKKASGIVRTVLTFQLLILIPMMFLMVFFANGIVGFLSDFTDSSQTAQAVTLFRYLIFYLALVSISAIFMASLNAVSKFAIPAVTPILFSISVIFSVALLYKSCGLYAMVIGVLFGGVAQILFQLPLFLKSGFSIKPLFDFRSAPFKHIMLRYFPVVISSGVFMGLQIFAQYLASKMEEGSISSLANSLVIWQLPFGIFSVSIITVLFPKMSRQVFSKDITGLKDSIDEGLSGFIAFILPSSLFLIFGAEIIVSAIYYRGEFTVENIDATVAVLRAYSVGILSVSAFQFLQRYFYASHSYGIPFLGALVVALIDIALSIIFYIQGQGATGLAWANTIAYTVAFIFLWILTAIKLNGIYLKKLLMTLLKVGFSMVPMVGIIILFNHLFPSLYQHSRDLLRLSSLFLLAIACIFPVLGLYLLLKVEVFSDIILSRVRRRK